MMKLTVLLVQVIYFPKAVSMLRLISNSIFIVILALGGCSMTDGLTITESNDNSQEGYISVKGGKVWYKIVGKNQKGTPLLILHGGPGVSHDYLEPLSRLSTDRPIIFYDQLGCGKSDRPGNPEFWTIEHYVDELEQLRRALDLKHIHILGQSWGTALAVDYILTKHPKGIESLILSGPLLSASRWIQDQKDYIGKLNPRTREIIQECEKTGCYSSAEYQQAMMEYYKLHICRIEPWPDCLNRSFEDLNFEIYKHMWGPSEFTVSGVLKDYERIEDLPKIDIPVLFLCGEYDEAAPATTRYYQQNLPGSEVFIFDDASHEAHLEKPQEYLQIVRGFLKRVKKD